MPTVPRCLAVPLLFLGVCLAPGGCVPTLPLVPVVETESGKVAGALSTGLAVFLGIPYAAPPVGPLRWREPQPPEPWDGVRSARAFGPACPQRPGKGLDGLAGLRTSEDCLTLNVWTPVLGRDARLPVLVWIHGGAFRCGSAATPWRNGANLAVRGLVVVTVDYRLGLFGFFAHPSLERERPDGPANFGLLDQIAALAWVKRNIAAFGGDPEQVTLGGDDAGATSILCLLGAPQARGLFQRAILQSPAGWFEPADRRQALDQGERLLAMAGLADAQASAVQLRSLPAEQLARIDVDAVAGPRFGPILDQNTVRLPPGERLARELQPRMPLLLGTTGDEAGAMDAYGIAARDVLASLGDDRARVAALYPEAGDEPALAVAVLGDRMFAAPARWLAATLSPVMPVWLYHLGLAPGHEPAGARARTPAHGDDVPYAFGTVARVPTWPGGAGSADRWLSQLVGDYWTSFVRTGLPFSDTGPPWPPCGGEHGALLRLDDVLRVDRDYRRQRLDTWLADFASKRAR